MLSKFNRLVKYQHSKLLSILKYLFYKSNKVLIVFTLISLFLFNLQVFGEDLSNPYFRAGKYAIGIEHAKGDNTFSIDSMDSKSITYNMISGFYPMYYQLFSSCAQYIVRNNETDKINMSQIILEPLNEARDTPTKIYKGDDDQYYLFFRLNYMGSGVSVIKAIREGRIQENKIVVRNNKGEIIGTDSLKFQSFEEGFLYKKDIVQTEKLDTTTTKAFKPEESKMKKIPWKVMDKIYTDFDMIPQAVKLTKLPELGSYVSVVIEVNYINPTLTEICDDSRFSMKKVFTNFTFCSHEDLVFEKTKDENEKRIDAIIKGNKPDLVGSQKFIISDNQIESNKSYLKQRIETLGYTPVGTNLKSVIEPEKVKYTYKEWRLISQPFFFQIGQ